MKENKKIKIGIGFATGRKSFQKVLKTYVYDWQECRLPQKENISLELIVAYDLKYSNTKASNFTNIQKDIFNTLNNVRFINDSHIKNDITDLMRKNIINKKEANLIYGNGYAAKRNSILYTAIKDKVDYLIFFDDDEYPVAVTNTHSHAVWGGQHILLTHLKYIKHADITNGYHCGYVSPIPYLDFNNILTESDFRTFIEAISNDIINWDSICSIMNNGGITYADTNVLVNHPAYEIPEINHAKFISGSNLCINLTDPNRVFPFYNPPNARGEDTFLSTCLSGRKVLRVPCYSFHDAFSTYHHIMDGVLPTKFRYVKADSERIILRFYNACIGWIRYKPLYLYITQKNNYKKYISKIDNCLSLTLPRICTYFKNRKFMNILNEFKYYSSNVKEHFEQFLEIQKIWSKIVKYITCNPPVNDNPM